MTTLPSDPDALYVLIEPLFGPLNEPGADFAALRARLPAAKSTTKRFAKRTTLEGALVVTGAAVFDRGVELAEGAALVVLGDLTITGGLLAPPQGYSLVVVGGMLVVDRAHTAGDVIAFGGVRAEAWWGSGNDCSTYAPWLEAKTYVASEDRGDVFGERRVGETFEGAQGLAAVRERLGVSDARSVESLRGFVGLSVAPKRAAPKAKAGEVEAMRAELEAAWALPTRREKVMAMRAAYAKIGKRRVPEFGELLVERMLAKRASGEDWSIQDELELLATLGRADLLVGLPAEVVAGWEGWMEGLIARARESR